MSPFPALVSVPNSFFNLYGFADFQSRPSPCFLGIVEVLLAGIIGNFEDQILVAVVCDKRFKFLDGVRAPLILKLQE